MDVEYKVKVSAETARRLRLMAGEQESLTERQIVTLAVGALSRVRSDRLIDALAALESDFNGDKPRRAIAPKTETVPFGSTSISRVSDLTAGETEPED